MYKLLINELHRQIEEKEATDTDEENEEDDEEEENGGGATTDVDDGYIRTLGEEAGKRERERGGGEKEGRNGWMKRKRKGERK